MPVDNGKNVERFKGYVYKTWNCWFWVGSIRFGYGTFPLGRGHVAAHRFAYELFRGPIPNGLCVLHKCDIRQCVNPDHLFLGTNRENSIDMMVKAGTCKRGHERKGLGRCMTCRSAAKLRWYQRKKLLRSGKVGANG